MVTVSILRIVGHPTEMTPVKATFLSMFMLCGILMWGAGIYTAGAVGEHAVDGYGVAHTD